MSRASVPEDQRQDFCLYVDEFQNFSTDSFATIMSEARKYHLNLVVANQFTTQLSEEIRDAVFGNMGTIVSFRVGQNDVDMLSKYFQPAFDAEDLLRVPNFNTITRTLVGGVPTQPFSMTALPSLGEPNPQLATALKQLSSAKYGTPKAKAEAEIFARLATKEDAKPAYGDPFSKTPMAAGPQRRPMPAAANSKASSGSSFLDEWLAKRKVQTTPPAGIAPIKPAAPLIPQARDLATPKAANVSPGVQNISSEAVEDKEVATIAKELRDSLTSDPASPKTDGEIKISRSDQTHTDDAAEDTIFIDKEGLLHTKDETS